jgi:hypothetical protein
VFPFDVRVVSGLELLSFYLNEEESRCWKVLIRPCRPLLYSVRIGLRFVFDLVCQAMTMVSCLHFLKYDYRCCGGLFFVDGSLSAKSKDLCAVFFGVPLQAEIRSRFLSTLGNSRLKHLIAFKKI